MRKPDFFIVGAPKCGTTAMYDYLGQHPEIFVPEEKEVLYFGADLILPGAQRDEQEYLAHFADVRDEKRVGHSFGWYLFSRRAAEEIKEFNPAVNIIIMLRNPVDMIYSLHSQRLYSGTEDIEDFREAIEAEQERQRGLRMPNYTWITRGLFYLEVARYAEQVKRYVDVFGWEKITLAIFDDFISNTRETYKGVCESLGVDARFEPVMNVLNPNKRARSRVTQDLLDRQAPKLVRNLGRFIPKRARRGLYKTLKNLNAAKEPRPPMDPELKRSLQARFLPDVERLSKLLDRDLTHWCKD